MWLWFWVSEGAGSEVGHIEVRVLDQRHQPLPFATVELEGVPAEPIASDARGRARLVGLSPAEYGLLVRAGDFQQRTWAHVRAGRTRRIEVVLPPFERTAQQAEAEEALLIEDLGRCATLKGPRGALGVWAGNGPLSWPWMGGRVVLSGVSSEGSATCSEGRLVDEEGYAWFSNLPPGRYTLQLIEPGPEGELVGTLQGLEISAGLARLQALNLSEDPRSAIAPEPESVGRFVASNPSSARTSAARPVAGHPADAQQLPRPRRCRR